VAVGYPIVSSYSVLVITAVLFIIAGLISVFGSLFSGGAQSFFFYILIGAIYIVFAYLLLKYPYDGIIALTMLLSSLLLVGGIIKIIYALRIKPLPHWRWLLASGIISIILCIFIYTGFPITSTFILGLIVGFYFLANGITIITYSLSLRDKN
jgi:uncharacterized membrane protein HdeD (DUF308 family)